MQTRIIPGAALAMAVLAGAAGAFTIPDMEARDVPLAVPAPAKSGGTFAFDVSEESLNADTLYAVHVAASGDEAPRISINGSPILSAPMPAEGGWLYRIAPLTLTGGTNELAVDATPTGAVSGVMVFSLLDSFEEVHFNHAFAPPATKAAKAAPATHPDQARIDVLHYDIDITLNMASPSITAATVDVTVEATDDGVSQVVLDFQNNGGALAVSSVTLQPGGTALGVSQSGGRLHATLPAPINTGDQRTVRIAYSGTPDNSAGAFQLNVFNRTSNNGSGHPVIYTFNEPYNARYWFPCKDLPDDKATADISITCPTAYIPVSNGVLTGIDSLGGGLHRYNWSESHPLPTYLVSIACTNFDYDSTTYTALDAVTTMEVGHYTWPGEIPNGTEVPLLANTTDILAFFAQTFGEYAFLDEKYVTATWGGSFGMEHQTATSINNGNLLSVAQPGKSRRNIHELAHSWFGNQVTNDTFDHLWLQEGWATLCEALYYEYDTGPSAYFAQIAAWMGSSINNDTPLVNTNADAFQGSLVYRKGALVLHMLRGVMGDAAFFQDARDYLAAHAYGTVITQDFEDAMEAAHGAQLDWFFDEWVYGTSRPNYTWSWVPAAGNSIRVDISQSGTFFEMPIDVRLSLAGGGTETVTLHNDTNPQSFTVTPASGTVADVEFDPVGWIYKTATQVAAPTAPAATIRSVIYDALAETVRVSWSSGGGSTDGFELQASEDRQTWTTLADDATLTAGTTEYVEDLFSAPYYTAMCDGGVSFRVRALSDTDAPSPWSDVYHFRNAFTAVAGRRGLPGPFGFQVLVVDAFDRDNISQNPQPHAWAAINGESVSAFQAGVDTCANEELGSTVDLMDYAAVIWVASEESTQDESFSDAEQTLVSAYLQGGGALFVSGAEIGWDLDRPSGPMSSDRAFYNDFLKADYVSDDSNDYTVSGVSGSILDGLAFAFDDGTGPTYRAEFPDVLALSGGSTAALAYNGSNYAAVQFAGTFPGGTSPGKLVNMGFGFETIVDDATRDEVMERVLVFFGISPANCDTRIDNWSLY